MEKHWAEGRGHHQFFIVGVLDKVPNVGACSGIRRFGLEPHRQSCSWVTTHPVDWPLSSLPSDPVTHLLKPPGFVLWPHTLQNPTWGGMYAPSRQFSRKILESLSSEYIMLYHSPAWRVDPPPLTVETQVLTLVTRWHAVLCCFAPSTLNKAHFLLTCPSQPQQGQSRVPWLTTPIYNISPRPLSAHLQVWGFPPHVSLWRTLPWPLLVNCTPLPQRFPSCQITVC